MAEPSCTVVVAADHYGLPLKNVVRDHIRSRGYQVVDLGVFTDDPLETFGSSAVVEVPNLSGLMNYICRNGFAHHTAMNASHVSGILKEAFENYLGWETYWHEGTR